MSLAAAGGAPQSRLRARRAPGPGLSVARPRTRSLDHLSAPGPASASMLVGITACCPGASAQEGRQRTVRAPARACSTASGLRAPGDGRPRPPAAGRERPLPAARDQRFGLGHQPQLIARAQPRGRHSTTHGNRTIGSIGPLTTIRIRCGIRTLVSCYRILTRCPGSCRITVGEQYRQVSPKER